VKQVISMMLCFCLVFPAPLFAQEAPAEPVEKPKVVEVKAGDSIPFDGVLLNPAAAAQMLANQKFLEAECKLKIDFEISKLQAQHDLLYNNLQLNLSSTEKKYSAILDIKDEEIERINKIALESSGDYSHWWAAGGFLLGAAVALGIFFAAAEAGN